MSNMRIWNEVKQPPPEALKQIGGGRLKGMTDVKPQWRFKAMTELFGPCGVGWKYEVVNMQTMECANGEIPLFVDVFLYFKEEKGDWSSPIPGSGGSMLVANESKGPYVSDEAYKMAVTDALSTAMKYIGVAADIYAGLWDGTKYKTPAPEHRFKPGEKEKIYKQVTDCLQNGDEHGLKEILAEYDGVEEKMKVWSIFNSTERASIKALLGE